MFERALRKLCSNCKKRSLCTEPCKELEKLLPGMGYTREKLGTKKGGDYRESAMGIDKQGVGYGAERDLYEMLVTIGKILGAEVKVEPVESLDENLGALGGEVNEEAVEAPGEIPEIPDDITTSPNYVESINILMQKCGHIFKNKKDKAYFKSYLKCATFKQIKKRADISIAALQKKYVQFLIKSADIISQGRYKIPDDITPFKFKQKLIELELIKFR